MSNGSPFKGRSRVGTSPRGARSESVDTARWRLGRVRRDGGDDGRIPVEEVGTGVG